MPKTYQISLHADKLRRRLFGGKPTPYAVVSVKGKDIGRTEIREPTTEPDWCVSMKLDVSAGQAVLFVVSIYDHRGKTSDKLLAKVEFEATEVHQSPGHMQMKSDNDSGAEIFVDIQESVQGPSRGYMKLHLRGLDIKNVEPGLLGLGRSDPFFEISKKNSDHASGVVRWNSIYRSEYIEDHLNPFWEEFSVGLEELCYCDLDWPLKVSVFDWEKSGKHRLIGDFEVTAQKMIENVVINGNADWEQGFGLILGEKAKFKGLINVLKAELTLEEGTIVTSDAEEGPSSIGVENLQVGVVQ